jgi:hypothetical protein
VDALGLQSVLAEEAGPVGEGERHHDEIADFHRAHLSSNLLDHADRLVAHRASIVGRLHALVGPEVAAADAGAGDADQGVGRVDQLGVRDLLDANVSGAVHDGGSHLNQSSPSR